MSENNKMKTNIRILGEINIETLKTFLEETDTVIEEFAKYQAESFMIKKELLQPFPPITIEISSYGGCT